MFHDIYKEKHACGQTYNLKVVGIHCVLCECGKMYVVQMGRTIETMCKEHMRHIGLGQSDKLLVAQHKFGTGHNMEYGNTSILDIALGYMDCLI
jgi:hypothetical protein